MGRRPKRTEPAPTEPARCVCRYRRETRPNQVYSIVLGQT